MIAPGMQYIPEEIFKEIGFQLKIARLRKNLSARQVCDLIRDKLNEKPPAVMTYYNIENGRRPPTSRILLLMAEAVGLKLKFDVNFTLTPKDEESPLGN